MCGFRVGQWSECMLFLLFLLLLAQSLPLHCLVMPLYLDLSCRKVWLSLCLLQLLLQCLIHSVRWLHLCSIFLPQKRHTPDSCMLW